VSASTIPLLLVGLVCLVAGAEFLVRGAAAVAERLGIAPVVVGLTVVAFGTSAPEFAVSVSAALSGETDVALGNVVGSNIVNVLLILGASAVVGGLVVSARIIRIDIPIMIGVGVVAFVMSLDNSIGRVDGAILFAGIIAYTVWLIRAARKEKQTVSDEYQISNEAVEGSVRERPMWMQIGLVLVGLGILVLGSQLLVGSATDIATELGVSDLVIGLTVVAIGTSLPEFATSMLAAYRGQRDIAVGNVVGSNIFNLMCVLGASGLLAGDGIPVSDAALRLDFPVMLAVSVVLLPIVWNGFMIKRWEGLLLCAFYVVYVVYLILDSNDHDASSVVGPAALLVSGLVLLTLSVAGYQGWRRHQASGLPIP
jgi:cation:H+ antiporter